MASGTRLREAGLRKPQRIKGKGLLDSSLGIHSDQHGEHRLNLQQVYALEHLFQSSPAVQAARTVLAGQLLSGGISLRKEGTDVELTQQFRDHLSEVWIPFASEVIDCFLKWGLVPISYEEHFDDVRNASLLYSKRQKTQPVAAPTGKRVSKAAAAAKAAEEKPPPIIIPIVPTLGTYEVAFRMGGRMAYKREYVLYSCAPGQGTKEDDEARVIVRQHPDSVGNVNSPLASVFDLGSFIGALNELAITAEASRARPRITTQLRKKDAAALDPGNLFFDSESRAVQSGADAGEGAAAARALQLQQQLCDVINRLQTRKDTGPDHDLRSFGGNGKHTHHTGYAPAEVQPTLFTLPKEHELAPHTQNPESRGDLEGLSRMVVEQFSAALGVPSDLIFSGRFAGKSTSQLSLLNQTVSQLAKSVNSVLTVCYRDIYAQGPEDDVGQLQLLTSPMAATEEVLSLYAGGLVPVEVAMPSVMHAIGSTKEMIDQALEKAVKDRDQKERLEHDEVCRCNDEHKMAMQEREANLQKTKKETEQVGKPAPSSGGGSSK